MMLPRDLTLAVGAIIFVFSLFTAYSASMVLDAPADVLQSIVVGYAGLWLMLATFSGMWGTIEGEQLLQRIGAMVALLVALIIAALYIHDRMVMGLLMLVLVSSGAVLTTTYLRSRS